MGVGSCARRGYLLRAGLRPDGSFSKLLPLRGRCGYLTSRRSAARISDPRRHDMIAFTIDSNTLDRLVASEWHPSDKTARAGESETARTVVKSALTAFVGHDGRIPEAFIRNVREAMLASGTLHRSASPADQIRKVLQMLRFVVMTRIDKFETTVAEDRAELRRPWSSFDRIVRLVYRIKVKELFMGLRSNLERRLLHGPVTHPNGWGGKEHSWLAVYDSGEIGAHPTFSIPCSHTNFKCGIPNPCVTRRRWLGCLVGLRYLC